jgi:hypothetical protein
VAAAAPALDRISHGVDFDTTPIETALIAAFGADPQLGEAIRRVAELVRSK